MQALFREPANLNLTVSKRRDGVYAAEAPAVAVLVFS
jgi:hypothetical protein